MHISIVYSIYKTITVDGPVLTLLYEACIDDYLWWSAA